MAQAQAARVAKAVAGRPAAVGARGSARFEWAMVLFALLPMLGAYLDAWAHSHIARLETFFTPWHAVLYSGILAVTAFMAVSFARGYLTTRDWRAALPRGYGLSFVGCLMFAVGGVGDLTWHLVFGIEQGFQAVMSPTHLFLMLAMGMIVSGPLRAAWYQAGRQVTSPALLSTGLVLSAVSFFQIFDHPFVYVYALRSGITNEELGVLGIVLEAGVVSGAALSLARRFDLPFGALAFILALNSALLEAVGDQFSMIAVAALAGLGGDLLLRVLGTDRRDVRTFRALAFAIPALLFGVYFADVARLGGVAWPVHVWTGSIAVAGAVGWLVSYIMVPAGQSTWSVNPADQAPH